MRFGSERGAIFFPTQAEANTITVDVEPLVFTPSNVTINLGDTVHWEFDNSSFPVEVESGATAGIFVSNGTFQSTVSFDFTFGVAGFYPYFDAVTGHAEEGAFGSITVLPAATTPLPAALSLFASGLGALGFFGWRRKRKNVSAIAA
jgi:plastocyanin